MKITTATATKNDSNNITSITAVYEAPIWMKSAKSVAESIFNQLSASGIEDGAELTMTWGDNVYTVNITEVERTGDLLETDKRIAIRSLARAINNIHIRRHGKLMASKYDGTDIYGTEFAAGTEIYYAGKDGIVIA